MKLQGYKRLLKTDYDKDDQDLVEQLGESINPGIEQLYQALDKRLTIKDNFQASEKDFSVSVDANGYPRSDTYVNIDFKNAQVRTVFVGKVENVTNDVILPTAAVFVSWANTQNGIQITNVKGLPIGYTFKIRVVMFA